MKYTALDENRSNELKNVFFRQFEQYKSDSICCSVESGLELLRRQGSVYAIIDSRVVSANGIELAEWICGEPGKLNEGIYCFDDGIVNGSWSAAFIKEQPEGEAQCLYNDWRTDCHGLLFKGNRLYRRKYMPFPAWEHEHCAMCWAKFSDDDGELHIGWCEHDNPNEDSRWICDECFCDLKQVLDWRE